MSSAPTGGCQAFDNFHEKPKLAGLVRLLLYMAFMLPCPADLGFAGTFASQDAEVVLGWNGRRVLGLLAEGHDRIVLRGELVGECLIGNVVDANLGFTARLSGDALHLALDGRPLLVLPRRAPHGTSPGTSPHRC
jgi:hypothetical protein